MRAFCASMTRSLGETASCARRLSVRTVSRLNHSSEARSAGSALMARLVDALVGVV